MFTRCMQSIVWKTKLTLILDFAKELDLGFEIVTSDCESVVLVRWFPC